MIRRALATAVALILAGCATPRELKQPPAAPTMARDVPSDPVPAYAATQPQSHP